ncbi:MAG: hypothetical protein JW837_04710 [Sedimentisphaerales bacterium]|nr:hypothetical protein [Sedimentisphaerales bacterium]
MSSTQKKIRCILSAALILICMTSHNGWINSNKAQMLTSANASQNPIQFQGNQNAQLQKFLQERYDVQRAVATLLNQQYSTGKVGILEIRDAIIDMMESEAELYPTNSERIKVYEKLVIILQQQDKSLAVAVNAGKANQIDFMKARAATLQVQIKLEKLKLSQ